MPYDLHVCMPPPPPPHISYIQTPHRTKAYPVLNHFSIAMVNIMIKAFYKRKCLIILGFQGFRVHDGGEKDLTLLPTITRQKGQGKEWRKEERERDRESIGHYRSLWKPQSLTPSDTPHPFQTISPAGYQAFKCVSLDWRDGSAVKGWVHKQIHEPLGAVLIQTTTPVIWVTSFLLSLPSHS